MLENASNLLFIYFAGDFICILIEIVFNRSGVPDYNTHTYIHIVKFNRYLHRVILLENKLTFDIQKVPDSTIYK